MSFFPGLIILFVVILKISSKYRMPLRRWLASQEEAIETARLKAPKEVMPKDTLEKSQKRHRIAKRNQPRTKEGVSRMMPKDTQTTQSDKEQVEELEQKLTKRIELNTTGNKKIEVTNLDSVSEASVDRQALRAALIMSEPRSRRPII